jgi:hypothetical protein
MFQQHCVQKGSGDTECDSGPNDPKVFVLLSAKLRLETIPQPVHFNTGKIWQEK